VPRVPLLGPGKPRTFCSAPLPLWYSLPNHMAAEKNTLYYGDNLDVLTEHRII
jgi:hypothetical protein